MAGRYSDDEMKEILRRALEGDASSEGVEHEDLVAAAAEVGIDRELVERAAIEMRDEREALERVHQRHRKRRRRFWKSLGTFGVVNAFLFAIDFVTPGGPWFYWPLLGWGLFVALHGLRVLPPMSSDTQRELVDQEKRRIARQRAKEARRLAKEAERRARRERRGNLSSAESAFEAAVEEGVTALLGALADQLSRATQTGPGQAPSEFDRYVAKKKGDARVPAAGPSVEPSAPRARVSVDQAAAEVVEEELEAEARRRKSG